MWGQGRIHQRAYAAVRIIPTRVGTRFSASSILCRNEDHPHACGDKYGFLFPVLIVKGSSPRVWGQESKGYKDCFKFRIIPTRVGTSGASRSTAIDMKDHPHACGDKMFSFLSFISYPGSSPRVWGQVRFASSTIAAPGIIPTRVGTRLVNAWWQNVEKDHPHACGDKKNC